MNFVIKLLKDIILENQKKVSKLLYEHDICDFSEIEETAKTSGMMQETYNTIIISLIKSMIFKIRLMINLLKSWLQKILKN